MFGPEFIKKALPKSLQPLLDLVGPSFFKAMPWREMTKEGRSLLAHLADSDSAQRAVAETCLSEFLKGRQIHLLPMIDPKNSTKIAALNKKMGEKILELYFLQLRNEQGLFLDLRAQRFSVIGKDLYFSNGKLWTQLQNPFRQSLLDLYRGFYESKPQLFDQGLTGVGLMTDKMSTADRKQIKDLFIQNFGEGDQTAVHFSTENFLQSFEKIFRFMVEQKLQISGQFLYLGIYLASLYQNLQTLNIPLNVRDSYHKAMKD